MDSIREEILDHYRNPRNQGMVKGATHKADKINASCGDKVSFSLLVDDGGVIKEIGWMGEGCSISMASASMLSEQMLGKKLEEIKMWGEKEMSDLVGEVNPGRSKCVMLSLSAVKEL